MNIPFISRLIDRLFGARKPNFLPDATGASVGKKPATDLNDPWWRFMLFDYKPHGDSFRDVLGFDRIEFDTHHDFIQWLFPNRVGSPVNPVAPLLTDGHVDLYRRLPELRRAVDQAIEKFYSFLGFQESSVGFTRADDFEKGSQYWLCRVDHNHRRISRLLTFLCEVGERGRAQSLLGYLEAELAERDLASIEATAYWRAILAAPISGTASA